MLAEFLKYSLLRSQPLFGPSGSATRPHTRSPPPLRTDYVKPARKDNYLLSINFSGLELVHSGGFTYKTIISCCPQRYHNGNWQWSGLRKLWSRSLGQGCMCNGQRAQTSVMQLVPKEPRTSDCLNYAVSVKLCQGVVN